MAGSLGGYSQSEQSRFLGDSDWQNLTLGQLEQRRNVAQSVMDNAFSERQLVPFQGQGMKLGDSWPAQARRLPLEEPFQMQIESSDDEKQGQASAASAGVGDDGYEADLTTGVAALQ